MTVQEVIAYLENEIKDINRGLNYNIYERDRNIEAIHECEETIAALQKVQLMLREDYNVKESQ